MDAYCKLEGYGIQIYAAIDAYSRHIIWAYVGVTGRTQISTLAQYLATLRATNVLPEIIRSDRGRETFRLADAHFVLSQRARPRVDSEPLQFSDVYKFGTSKMNQRIEGWWGQLAGSSINRWRDAFESLEKSRDYNQGFLADRIAFIAIYVPIIRHETIEFINLWNTHTIRKQPRRPHCVPGVPHVLYYYPAESGGERCGTPLDSVDGLEQQVDFLAEQLQGFGTYSVSTRLRTRLLVP